MLRLLLLLSVATLILSYHQNDYKVISERFEMFPNTKYFANFKYINFKYNRTFHAVNMSTYFKIDFKRNVSFVTQGYRFASNEYRLFPIQFDANMCDCLEQNTFGVQNLYNCGNAPRCPMVKGNYSTCLWQPDYTQFPPYIPTGRYMLELDFVYFGERVILVKWYLTVTRDEVKRV